MEIVSTTKNFILGDDGVTYFEVTRITYEDDSYDETARPVGPADQLASDQADKILRETDGLAVDSRRVSKTKQFLSDIGDTDTEITTLTTISPLKLIQGRFEALLLTPGWTIDEGAGFVPLVFTVNAQGNLRYNVNGTGAKAAKIYGSIIRLNNYPAAPTDTDFFLSENGNQYFSLPNRAVKIKKP